MNLPRIKRFPVDKRGVVVVPDHVSAFGFPHTDFGDEVSVHDYISEDGTGVALHGRPRSEEEQGKAAAKHICRITTNNLGRMLKPRNGSTWGLEPAARFYAEKGGRGLQMWSRAAVSECCKRGQSPGWCEDFFTTGVGVTE